MLSVPRFTLALVYIEVTILSSRSQYNLLKSGFTMNILVRIQTLRSLPLELWNLLDLLGWCIAGCRPTKGSSRQGWPTSWQTTSGSPETSCGQHEIALPIIRKIMIKMYLAQLYLLSQQRIWPLCYEDRLARAIASTPHNFSVCFESGSPFDQCLTACSGSP